MQHFTVWPDPVLTPQEAQGAGLYRTVLKDGTVVPGLLRRVYAFQLTNTLIPGEISVPSIRYVTSGLRSLMFGMTFSGDIEFWQISCRTASGEVLFDTSPVTALLNLPKRDGDATVSPAGAPGIGLNRPQSYPLIWDPPWLLDGTQALQVDGSVLTSNYVVGATDRGVLNLAFHVWEVQGAQGTRGPVPPTARVPPGIPVAKLRSVRR